MKQEKTDKRYILITNAKEDTWYRDLSGYVLPLSHPHLETDSYLHVMYDKCAEALFKSDAIEVSLVVPTDGGWLYAVGEETTKRNWVIKDNGNVGFYETGKVIHATNNPTLLKADGVLSIPNAEEVLRGLEGEKEQEDDDFWGKPHETDERYITSHHKFNQSLYDLDLAAYNKSKTAPVPADTDDYLNSIRDEWMAEWRKNNPGYPENDYWTGLTDGIYLLSRKLKETCQ